MNINIREIHREDFPQLLQLLHEFASFQKSSKQMKSTLNQMTSEQEFFKGFVAEQKGDIVAYVTYNFVYYTWSGKSLYMDDLYVKPEFRGHGLGKELIQRVIKLGKTEKCHKLKWQVSEWNAPAIAFYKNLGASIDATESNCELSL